MGSGKAAPHLIVQRSPAAPSLSYNSGKLDLRISPFLEMGEAINVPDSAGVAETWSG